MFLRVWPPLFFVFVFHGFPLLGRPQGARLLASPLEFSVGLVLVAARIIFICIAGISTSLVNIVFLRIYIFLRMGDTIMIFLIEHFLLFMIEYNCFWYRFLCSYICWG